jgi:uncharacterized membrane protein YbaN (DUF454 family)
VNRDQAKEVLLLFRPGTADAEDPQIIEAMELARRDPELGRWFEQHRAFQSAVRLKFKQIEVPDHLKLALLAGGKVIHPQMWWQRSVVWAAAAIVVILIGISALWLKPAPPDRFSNYRERMVSTALREYRMDVLTQNMSSLRESLKTKGAPADYEISPGLERLRLTGGAALTWRSHPVSMVCFDRGDKQMLFLFVMKRASVKDPPALQPVLGKMNNLMTASWTKGDDAYLLLGPPEPGFAGKYLPPNTQ